MTIFPPNSKDSTKLGEKYALWGDIFPSGMDNYRISKCREKWMCGGQGLSLAEVKIAL
jgi:hypothetical protein